MIEVGLTATISSTIDNDCSSQTYHLYTFISYLRCPFDSFRENGRRFLLLWESNLN